ncbi:unnamed protein product [Gulo gulo]|uniref:Uncharacterized protein n=1 Tax=Gulo gulo TaxID=48420 RepID=A0A9X9LET2_GULGU|nr:unnamed protein product [Gulo gulo]
MCRLRAQLTHTCRSPPTWSQGQADTTKPAPHPHALRGDPTHLSCGGRCCYLNHFGQKVLGKRKLGQSPNSTVVVCHFKGTPPGRTKISGEKSLSSWARSPQALRPRGPGQRRGRAGRKRHGRDGRPSIVAWPVILSDTQHDWRSLRSPRHVISGRGQGPRGRQSSGWASVGPKYARRKGPCCHSVEAQPHSTMADVPILPSQRRFPGNTPPSLCQGAASFPASPMSSCTSSP